MRAFLQILEYIFRRHIALWALLAGFFVGSLNKACLDLSDRWEPTTPPPIVSTASCIENPMLCALPEEVHKQILREQIRLQIKEVKFLELDECVQDPGCELLGDQQEEYEQLKEELQ